MSEGTIAVQSISLPGYLDMQAELGFTKHLGGLQATRELMELCQISADKVLLIVGCGAGLSATYIAKTYGCRVVGVDIKENMVISARERAQRKGLVDQTDFRVGDAQALPFDDNQFDVLICESVNTFVPDKARAADEYVRVVKPGGYVGLNEAIWFSTPPPSVVETVYQLTGERIMTSDDWVAMLEGAGLVDLVVRTYPVNLRTEARNQIGLLGIPDYLRVLAKLISMYLRDPRTRAVMKLALPAEYYEHVGYGLYVGQKR